MDILSKWRKVKTVYTVYLMNKQPVLRFTIQCYLLYTIQEKFIRYVDDGRL